MLTREDTIKFLDKPPSAEEVNFVYCKQNKLIGLALSFLELCSCIHLNQCNIQSGVAGSLKHKNGWSHLAAEMLFLSEGKGCAFLPDETEDGKWCNQLLDDFENAFSYRRNNKLECVTDERDHETDG